MQTKQQHKNGDMLCKDTIAIWKGSNKNYFILDFELNSGLHQTQEEKQLICSEGWILERKLSVVIIAD